MSETILNGSCLCGEVTYRATGEGANFFHCHCGRCRKASGTGHASNFIVHPGQVEWLTGEDQVGRYAPPDAKRFHTSFCRNCGSPLPKFHEALKMVVIPAGTLDDAPPFGPNARIFWGSRAEWSCGDTGIPEFEEYPTRG